MSDIEDALRKIIREEIERIHKPPPYKHYEWNGIPDCGCPQGRTCNTTACPRAPKIT